MRDLSNTGFLFGEWHYWTSNGSWRLLGLFIFPNRVDLLVILYRIILQLFSLFPFLNLVLPDPLSLTLAFLEELRYCFAVSMSWEFANLPLINSVTEQLFQSLLQVVTFDDLLDHGILTIVL